MYAQKIQNIIKKKFIDRKNINPGTYLKQDLYFDDFDINILLNFLERDLDIKLPERVCDKYADISVAQLAVIVETNLKNQHLLSNSTNRQRQK